MKTKKQQPLLKRNDKLISRLGDNGRSQLDFSHILSSLDRRANISSDSSNISEAMMQKTVVRDEEKNRILGITDNVVIEFDDRIMEGLTLTSQNILHRFKQKIQNGTINYQSIAETLKYIEFTNAAFLDTPEFQKVKKELNKILTDITQNGTPEDVEMLIKGILVFFDASKNNITKGRKKFKNVPYAIENSKEKEFLRALFIGEMFQDGVFDYDFLETAGEIKNMDIDIIDSIYRQRGLFTPEQVVQALLTAGQFKSRDEVLEYYLEQDKKYFMSLATSEEIANYIIEGKISPKEYARKIRLKEIKDFSPELLEKFLCVPNFPKGVEFIDYLQRPSKRGKFLSKKLLSELDRERFLSVVLSKEIAKVYDNPYTSEDYVNEYGKLNSSDIINLEKANLIKQEDLIKLVRFKSIQIQDPTEYSRMVQDLLTFYDLDRLENLVAEGKINLKFAELYNELLTNMATKEQRDLYFESINRELQSKENSDEIVASLIQAGLKIGDSINYEVSEDFISEKYLNDEISEKDLMKLYEYGLISLDAVRALYSDTDIIEKYRNGDLDYKVLSLLENRSEIIKSELQADRLKMQELMELYSSKYGLYLEELLEITDGYNFENEAVVDYISDEITADKVEGLLTNYYISQDDLSALVSRGIITKKQAKEFSEKMATHEQYESIFSLDNRFITLIRQTEGNARGNSGVRGIPGTKRPGQVKNDPELQELLLSQIGFDERTLTLQGTNNSLDGYRIYPSEEYGVMVFLKNDKPGNATYIMSLQQGLYFLNKMVRERKNQIGEKEYGIVLQSDATKKELRETEHVKIRNASAGWGANIVDAIQKLSPAFREKMNIKSEYKKAIDDVVEEIKKDYRERKGRDE